MPSFGLKIRNSAEIRGRRRRGTVLATDPGAEQDLRDYCEATGCTFLSAGYLEGGRCFAPSSGKG